MIIGICGGTGSGKTTIARAIVEAIGADKVVLVEQDSYYRNMSDMPLDERRKANFDHPDSIDSDLLVNHLKRLKGGESIEMPIYDFKSHTRGSKSEHINPSSVIIVEGILIFAESRVLELLDVRVFVDTPDDIRLCRRLKRDIAERGRKFEQAIEQYEKTVRPMHQQFVEPSKRHADLIIPEGGHTQVGIDVLCGIVREKLRQEGKSSGKKKSD
jgi:uridine kinase